MESRAKYVKQLEQNLKSANQVIDKLVREVYELQGRLTVKNERVITEPQAAKKAA